MVISCSGGWGGFSPLVLEESRECLCGTGEEGNRRREGNRDQLRSVYTTNEL